MAEQPAGSTSGDHPAADAAVDVGVVGAAAVAAASSGHPASVAAVVGRAVDCASVDSCRAIAVQTFPCSSFRSCWRPSAAASACGAAAAALGSADRPGASGAGCGAEGAVAFASLSESCMAMRRAVDSCSACGD